MKATITILSLIILILLGYIIVHRDSTPKQLELIIPENPFSEASICRDCGNDNDDNVCSRFRVTTNLDLEDLHFGGPCFEKEFISENFKIVEFCVPSNGGYIEVSYPHCQPKKILFKEVIRGVVYTINIECVEKKIEIKEDKIKEDKIKEKQDEIITEEPKPEFNYLTFTAQEPNSSVGIENWDNNPDIEYSIDEGETWQKLTEQNPVALQNIGDKMFVRGNNREGFSFSERKYTSFKMTGKIAGSGSVMSLIDGKGVTLTIPNEFCFNELFSYNKSLTTAPELPATTLAEDCYHEMFCYCTNMTTAPELPAIILAKNCYYFMFSGCESLTSAPELPATTLAESCYYFMFSGCESLTSAPELPATTLAESCYTYMFCKCNNLTTAPELPATTLADECYDGMFIDCIKLITAPKLPATILAKKCYFVMFENCTSLTTAPELPATTLALECYRDMFYGCTNLTTAPELPATKLEKYCYQRMFNRCSNLSSAPKLPATKLAENCYWGMFYGCSKIKSVNVNFKDWEYDTSKINGDDIDDNPTGFWLGDVSSSGTFYCPRALSQKRGASFIPKGWNVKYID